MFQVLSFSTDELSTTYVCAKLRVFIKTKGDSYGKRGQEFTFTLFLEVACRVQIWKNTYCENSDKFGYSFIKNDIVFMHILYIYKKPIF